MLNFSLDVVFSSDNTPFVPTDYIVMSYGYVNDDLNEAQGQIIERMPQGAAFEFAVFDTAARAGTITQVQIEFTSSGTPFLDERGNPVSSPITLDTGFQGAVGDSVGCNVAGAMRWMVGSYTIAEDIPNLTKFTFTIIVSVRDSNLIEKTFGVDPEMIIDGSGSDEDAAPYG